MTERRRLKQPHTLRDRLSAWVDRTQEQAAKLPPGPERDALVDKARQAGIAAHLDDWVTSPGLRAPL